MTPPVWIWAAVWAVFARPLRSFLMVLTLSGGVAAVTLASAIMSGYAQRVEQIAFGAYVRSLVIRENWSVVDRFGPPTLNDLNALTEELEDQVEASAAWRQARVQVVLGAQNAEVNLYGVWGEYAYEADMPLHAGRLLTRQDTESAARVCVLGAGIAEKLAVRGAVDRLIGQTVRLNGVACEIVGVFGPAQTQTADRFNQAILTPILAAARYFHQSTYMGPQEVSQLTLVLRERSALNAARVTADQVLRRAHGAPLSHPAPFSFGDEAVPYQAVSRQRQMMQRLLSVIAGITLVAATLGYVTSMLALMDTRRRDIAIQMATGAAPVQILLQILTEGALIGLMGGCVGAMIGLAGSVMTPGVFNIPVAFDGQILALSVGVGAGAGVLAGAVPAWMAALAMPTTAMKS